MLIEPGSKGGAMQLAVNLSEIPTQVEIPAKSRVLIKTGAIHHGPAAPRRRSFAAVEARAGVSRLDGGASLLRVFCGKTCLTRSGCSQTSSPRSQSERELEVEMLNISESSQHLSCASPKGASISQGGSCRKRILRMRDRTRRRTVVNLNRTQQIA
jgi:hypothetical protein